MSLAYTPCGTKVVAVKDNGSAFVWDPSALSKKKKKKEGGGKAGTPVVKFPQDGGMFRGCFALDGKDNKCLFCLGVNGKGKKSQVTSWSLADEGSRVLRHVARHAHNSAITALA